jgi:hypothetical protein
MTLSYDDNAASVFGVTMLLFYLFPATWYIIKRIRTFNQKLKAAEGGEVLVEDDDMPLSTTGKGKAVEPRSRAEARKIQLLKATAKRDVLWTKGFKLFILGTVAVALLFLYLLFRSTGQAELAQYDPYAVSLYKSFRLARCLALPLSSPLATCVTTSLADPGPLF